MRPMAPGSGFLKKFDKKIFVFSIFYSTKPVFTPKQTTFYLQKESVYQQKHLKHLNTPKKTVQQIRFFVLCTPGNFPHICIINKE
jgi:hypothetical protein